MDKEIKDSEDFLKSLPSQGGFQIPDGYYDKLHAKVLHKVLLAEPKQAKTIPLYELLTKVAGVAAVAVMVAGMFWFNPNQNDKKQLSEQEIIDQLQDTEITPELLCDAGWCNELEALDLPENSTQDQILIEADTDLLIDEL